MRRALGLVLFAAGCGDGRSAPADGATAPDDGPPTVRVHYLAPPALANTATVYFQYDDSELALVTHTDNEGNANARLTRSGSVTVLTTRATSHFLYTYMGVEPGDDVTVDDRAGTGPTEFRHFSLQIPAVPNGSFYNLETACGAENVSPAANASAPVGAQNNLTDCPDNIDMLLTAFGNGISYQFHRAVPVVENSAVRFTDPYRPIDRVNITLVGADEANDAFVRLTTGTLGGHRLLSTLQSDLPITGGTSGASFETPAPPNASQMFDAVSLARGPGVAHLASWGPSATDVELDLARDMPHDYLTAPSYDPVANEIGWAEAPDGRLADVVFAVLAWQTLGANWQWQIQAPRSAEPHLQLPTLPTSLRPRDNILPIAALVNLTADGGLASVGAHLLGAWFPGAPWPADTASGAVRYREVGPL